MFSYKHSLKWETNNTYKLNGLKMTHLKYYAQKENYLFDLGMHWADVTSDVGNYNLAKTDAN